MREDIDRAIELVTLQHVQISHRDAAEHGADDTEEALVSASQVEILQVRTAVFDFVRCPVDCAVYVTRIFTNGSGGEHVFS